MKYIYAVVLVCALCQKVMSFFFNMNFASQLATSNHSYILFDFWKKSFLNYLYLAMYYT